MKRPMSILIWFSAIGSGLIAGIFFAFSNFVMKSLADVPAEMGIRTMQAINVNVLTPLFSLFFMGTALVSLVLIVYSFVKWNDFGFSWLLAGSLLYLLGSFMVTVMFNVPLNDHLAAVKPGTAESLQVWEQYLKGWTFWNHVRTIASIAALLSFLFALRGGR
jgi:uncharacterized membrane protein